MTQRTRKSSCVNARDTARCVASACFADQSPDGGEGGYPIQSLTGGYPIQSWMGGTLSSSGQGPTSSLDGGRGTLPHPDLGWGYPPSGGCCPPLPIWTWDGVPPPASHKCEQTENITFPHPSDAGGKNTGAVSNTRFYSK